MNLLTLQNTSTVYAITGSSKKLFLIIDAGLGDIYLDIRGDIFFNDFKLVVMDFRFQK